MTVVETLAVSLDAFDTQRSVGLSPALPDLFDDENERPRVSRV